jgi:hypothetical protein
MNIFRFFLATCSAVVATTVFADTAFIDLRHDHSERGRYFIGFAAYPVSAHSPTGHAIVIWGKEDPATKTSSYDAYGVYPLQPAGTEKGITYAAKVALGQVPAQLYEELKKALDEYRVSGKWVEPATDKVADWLGLQVNQDDYDFSRISIDAAQGVYVPGQPWSTAETPGEDNASANRWWPLQGNRAYRLLTNDCVSFVSIVAVSVGLPPLPRLPNPFPAGAINWLVNHATSQGSYTAPNGDVYKGDMVGKWPNGQSAVTFKNGSTYVGQVGKAYPNGQGVFTDLTGVTVTGQFSNGRPADGSIVRVSFPNGDWEDLRVTGKTFGTDGFALLHFSDGVTFRGYILKRRPFFGEWRQADGQSFRGWINGPLGPGTGNWYDKEGKFEWGQRSDGKVTRSGVNVPNLVSHDQFDPTKFEPPPPVGADPEWHQVGGGSTFQFVIPITTTAPDPTVGGSISAWGQ